MARLGHVVAVGVGEGGVLFDVQLEQHPVEVDRLMEDSQQIHNCRDDGARSIVDPMLPEALEQRGHGRVLLRGQPADPAPPPGTQSQVTPAHTKIPRVLC